MFKHQKILKPDAKFVLRHSELSKTGRQPLISNAGEKINKIHGDRRHIFIKSKTVKFVKVLSAD